ncbi:MAG TPA: histidine phosphatase family protein [Firmicutes bacterium]|jgi:broad specificity phosphatase PhoE|nr:MAG: hypothetical protein AA931_03005 [Peptococcaceae bacterium 1109]HHT72519.1 histidine phosphatase family protein [Bacillota bacterium]
MNLLLIRHGETSWNLEQRYQGQQDSPLSELGIAQAEKTAAFLARMKIHVVYTSDLLRAKLTAKAIARPHGLTPIEDKRLREINFGEWEGLTRSEVEARYPELFAARFRDHMNVRVPGGELPGEVAERLLDFVHELEERHPKENVAAVSHGGSLRLLIAALLGIPLERSYCLRMDNLGISHLSSYPRRGKCPWQAHCINSTAHLLV